jgi:starch synthase
MKVAIVSSEVAPFSKTGGLADVAGALPVALSHMDQEVVVITPLYHAARDSARKLGLELQDCGVSARFAIGGSEQEVRFVEGRLPDSDVVVYLLENDHYYDRPGLYVNPSDNEDYADNSERFVCLCRGALELCLEMGLKPDVFHCNDWQSGLLPLYVRHLYQNFYQGTGTVLTVHNLAYQGLFWSGDMNLTGLPWELFNWRVLEFYGKLSFLKAGLVSADVLTTVSRTYAEEIQTKEFGMGLEGVLRERAGDLVGIVNGVNYSVWDPQNDDLIEAKYSAGDLSGKAECKNALQEKMDLPVKEDVPVVGMVGRLASQKGLDLVADGLDRIMQREVQLVVLGTGDPAIQDQLTQVAAAHPGKLTVHIGFDEQLAHAIEAGSDMFLMPSRFEPCGLNQLYSLRYGTVPIVSTTGGLADTVKDYNADSGRDSKATGFCFAVGSTDKMVEAIGRAVDLYKNDRDAWRRLQLTGMAQDWSWERSAKQYVELYERAARKARGQ